MAQTSIKLTIESIDDTLARLINLLGAEMLVPSPDHAIIRHETDHTYMLAGTNGLYKMKLRENDAAVQSGSRNSLIIEKAFQHDGQDVFLHKDLAFISGIEPTRLSAFQQVMGPADQTIHKERQIMRSRIDPSLRIYLDRYHGHDGEHTLLEMQLYHDTGQNAQAQETLNRYIRLLDLEAQPMSSQSYSALNLADQFKGNHVLSRVFTNIPDRLAQKIIETPHYRAKNKHRIIRKDAKETHAFLITNGTAYADGGIKLTAGSLLGEFSIYEGRRTADVNVSEDFQARIIPSHLLYDIVSVPAFMMKYNQWKLQQAGIQHRYGNNP